MGDEELWKGRKRICVRALRQLERDGGKKEGKGFTLLS